MTGDETAKSQPEALIPEWRDLVRDALFGPSEKSTVSPDPTELEQAVDRIGEHVAAFVVLARAPRRAPPSTEKTQLISDAKAVKNAAISLRRDLDRPGAPAWLWALDRNGLDVPGGPPTARPLQETWKKAYALISVLELIARSMKPPEPQPWDAFERQQLLHPNALLVHNLTREWLAFHRMHPSEVRLGWADTPGPLLRYLMAVRNVIAGTKDRRGISDKSLFNLASEVLNSFQRMLSGFGPGNSLER